MELDPGDRPTAVQVMQELEVLSHRGNKQVRSAASSRQHTPPTSG